MRSIVGLFIGLFITIGCSKKAVTWKPDAVDVSKYRTYAFLPPGDTSLNSSLYNSTLKEMIEEINKDLKQSGYVLRPEKPELLVMIHTNLDKDINYLPSAYPYYTEGFYERPYYDAYYYYPDYPELKGFGASTGITSVEYPKGTIVIDFIDRKSGDIIWRGKTRLREYQNISDQQDIEGAAREVREEVDVILDNIPASRG